MTSVELAAHSQGEWNVETVLGHFVDAAWAYRFGPPAQDAIVVSLERDGGTEAGPRTLCQAVRFPAERPLERESPEQLGLAVETTTLPDGDVRLALRSRRLAYGVRVDAPGLLPSDDGFFIEPGGERERDPACDGRAELTGRWQAHRAEHARLSRSRARRWIHIAGSASEDGGLGVVSLKIDQGVPSAGSPTTNAPEPPRPMYLQPPGVPPVFAVLHRGVHPQGHTAVLLCPPFGWEDMCCYRIRREWAEHLARAGHTTLRIDLPGSGDSAGAPTDPGQLETWTRAVDGAARWLRQAAHARQVAAIGISLGGLVACRAALQGAPIDELVLWSVPARGRTFLRELRAFSAFEVANIPDAGEGAPGERVPDAEPADDGTLATNGYLMSAETVLALQGLDLAQVEPSATRVRRALLLGRDGMKVAKALPEALTSAGAEVTVADGPGYGAMMVEPQDARTPIEVIERVSSWLEEGESRGEVFSSEAESEDGRGTQSRPRRLGAR